MLKWASGLCRTKLMGQTSYLTNPENVNAYGIGIDVRQYEVFGKYGFAIPNTYYASVGSMFSISRHEQNSFFGEKTYSGTQNSIYANVIFQTIIHSDKHLLNFGGSFVYDDFQERFMDTDYLQTENYLRVFTQYTLNIFEKFSLITGVRLDFHNIHGILFTPRIHAKYNINETLSILFSAGKAYRTTRIFAENQSTFASSRVLVIEEEFKPEEAWNYGLSFSGKFKLGGNRESHFGIDYFRTDFVNQVIADINTDVHEIHFYNLQGQSYSNSIQAEFSIQPVKRFDIFTAVRFNDVHVTMNNKLIESPFVNKYKGLLTLSYATKYNRWMFDITNQFNGKAPLPDFTGNPEAFQVEAYSPAYYILHAQVTKRFKRLELYVGAENLTDFKQDRLIIYSENPFGEYFDASVIWCRFPAVGSMPV